MNGELCRLAKLGWNIEDHCVETGGVWTTCNSQEVSFPQDGHQALLNVDDDSFWFAHRNRVIDDAIRSIPKDVALWDVGGGNGFVAKALEATGREVVLVEPMEAGARNAVARGLTSICGTISDLGLPSRSLQLIGCFDVIEHVQDSRGFFAELGELLAPGGVLVVAVPAGMALWGEFDEISGHFSRYSKPRLSCQAESAGLIVERLQYFMLPLVIPALVMRAIPYRLGRRSGKENCMNAASTHLSGLNRLAKVLIEHALSIERFVSRLVPVPYGTSLIGVFRKPSK